MTWWTDFYPWPKWDYLAPKLSECVWVCVGFRERERERERERLWGAGYIICELSISGWTLVWCKGTFFKKGTVHVRVCTQIHTHTHTHTYFTRSTKAHAASLHTDRRLTLTLRLKGPGAEGGWLWEVLDHFRKPFGTMGKSPSKLCFQDGYLREWKQKKNKNKNQPNKKQISQSHKGDHSQ